MRLQSLKSARAGADNATGTSATNMNSRREGTDIAIRDHSRFNGRITAGVFSGKACSAADQRAGAVVGEQLEQHRVRHLAVKDHDAFDALLEGGDACLYLWDHAARNR